MNEHPEHDPDEGATDGPDAPLSAADAELVAAAAQLPVLRPSRDLWDGIAARISTPEVALPQRTATRYTAAWSVAQLATAAAVLVAVTAGVTWQVAQQRVAPTPEVAVLIQADDESATALPTLRVAAAYDLLHRLGKDYEKPEFGIRSVDINGQHVAIHERVEIDKPFCELRRFKRYADDPATWERRRPSAIASKEDEIVWTN
jgi:hypothetical protein